MDKQHLVKGLPKAVIVFLIGLCVVVALDHKNIVFSCSPWATKFPDFIGYDAYGSQIRFSSIRNDKSAVVLFTSIYSYNAEQLAPLIDQVADEYKDEDVRFLTVHAGSDGGFILRERALLRNQENNLEIYHKRQNELPKTIPTSFPFIVDANGEITREYTVIIPTVYFVNRAGYVHSHAVGYKLYYEHMIRDEIKEMLKEAK